MNSIIDESALKQVVLYLSHKSLELKLVDPNNNDELNELKNLSEQGLVKFQVIDVSTSFIAHEDIMYKLINDFSGQNSFSEIIDRNIKSPSLLQIYASNVWLKKTALSYEQFERMVREENLMLENYKNLKSRHQLRSDKRGLN